MRTGNVRCGRPVTVSRDPPAGHSADRPARAHCRPAGGSRWGAGTPLWVDDVSGGGAWPSVGRVRWSAGRSDRLRPIDHSYLRAGHSGRRRSIRHRPSQVSGRSQNPGRTTGAHRAHRRASRAARARHQRHGRLRLRRLGREHLDYSNWLHRIWYPARQQAGVEWAQFHDLRRANATGLVLEGIDLKTAQTRLGHTDPRLTLGIYAQATTEADRQAADRLGDRFLPRRDQDRGRGLA
ncbi:MAG: tyrosine-type recombinase/integrase [Acidimicrobiia bacterium]|nr:tyrosine-type recombinase/integrase [Acidimicrobiia bacterium]